MKTSEISFFLSLALVPLLSQTGYAQSSSFIMNCDSSSTAQCPPTICTAIVSPEGETHLLSDDEIASLSGEFLHSYQHSESLLNIIEAEPWLSLASEETITIDSSRDSFALKDIRFAELNSSTQSDVLDQWYGLDLNDSLLALGEGDPTAPPSNDNFILAGLPEHLKRNRPAQPVLINQVIQRLNHEIHLLSIERQPLIVERDNLAQQVNAAGPSPHTLRIDALERHNAQLRTEAINLFIVAGIIDGKIQRVYGCTWDTFFGSSCLPTMALVQTRRDAIQLKIASNLKQIERTKAELSQMEKRLKELTSIISSIDKMIEGKLARIADLSRR